MAKAWKEQVVIPTYEAGTPEKNPIFLEKRVYQGSSGVVYPYPVIEKIADEKTDHTYNAVFLENEYIKVMILPELGGRVQMAYDKIKQRHFVYYNHVVKPALVGLAGPWISGGIEFNWPQHHRPSTFMPVDTTIEEHADGSVTVWVNEMERMFHQKGMAGFTLRPGCAYLEIKGVLYNRTDLPQTFLWWANPAVAVNDHYQSVFPPDVNAVFDHGKRAVSSFPIATGTYYKMDYSAGVDISNYKNIKVPTSYMGVNSRYDFEGGYENDTQAGMLHVASHHVSPGKKQWTWGNGDFGRAWDRNLTDEDGPYIELMAGVYTENQPDFTWLMPYEEKSFTQYFLPYRELGIVKNASKDFLMNIDLTADGKITLKIFATSRKQAKIMLAGTDGTVLLSETVEASPEAVIERTVEAGGHTLADLKLTIAADGRTALTWEAEPDEIRPIPDAAEAALEPQQIKTVEQSTSPDCISSSTATPPTTPWNTTRRACAATPTMCAATTPSACGTSVKAASTAPSAISQRPCESSRSAIPTPTTANRFSISAWPCVIRAASTRLTPASTSPPGTAPGRKPVTSSAHASR